MFNAQEYELADKKLEELKKSFWRSDLMKAIEEYINKCGVGRCGLIDKTGDLHFYRGQGAFCYSRGNIYIRPPALYQYKDWMRIGFHVAMYNEDEEVDQNYVTIDFPIDLAENFTPEKFNELVKQREERRHKIDRIAARNKLRMLFAHYPFLKGEVQSIEDEDEEPAY